jgi:hypothetical protein
MSAPVPRFSNDDDAAQYWLRLLRDGDADQKIQAREQLAAVFERRGMLEEATDLLISNVQDGVRNADIFRWLARLYRNQGQEVLAMQAAAEAAKYLPVMVPVRAVPAMAATVADSPGGAPVATGMIVRQTAVAHKSTGGSGFLRFLIAAVCLVVFGTIGLFVFGAVLGALVGPKSTTSSAGRSGKAEVNLGIRPVVYGSQAQAQDLLNVMDQQPSKASYNVAYETEIDAVVIGADFTKDVLARVHQKHDGHGSTEVWHGYILERLRSAASGGSLNDTPAGKSLVDFQSF